MSFFPSNHWFTWPMISLLAHTHIDHPWGQSFPPDRSEACICCWVSSSGSWHPPCEYSVCTDINLLEWLYDMLVIERYSGEDQQCESDLSEAGGSTHSESTRKQVGKHQTEFSIDWVITIVLLMIIWGKILCNITVRHLGVFCQYYLYYYHLALGENVIVGEIHNCVCHWSH